MVGKAGNSFLNPRGIILSSFLDANGPKCPFLTDENNVDISVIARHGRQERCESDQIQNLLRPKWL